jgi:hypothetical protein
MQSEAGWVLSKAGISTTWIGCPFSTEPAEANSPCVGRLGGTRFLVRLTRDHVTHHGSIWDTTMGFAHITPNGGSYATVLMDPVEELTREQQLVSQAQILGHAVAHEIGHLVMGLNSHSPRGLMRAGWKANDLRDMAERHLLFSKREGERMRVRIAMYDDAVSCNPAQHETGTRAITVRIYNLAEVPAKEVGQARNEAGQIFKQASIEVRWLSCALSLQEARTNTACEEATGRHDFDVVVSTASITRPGIATDASLGFAFPFGAPKPCGCPFGEVKEHVGTQRSTGRNHLRPRHGPRTWTPAVSLHPALPDGHHAVEVGKRRFTPCQRWQVAVHSGSGNYYETRTHELT